MKTDVTDALIVVDVQNCFLPGGSLGVEEGDRVIPVINRLMPLFEHKVYTRDWHPPDHVSFAAESPEYRDLSWPPHCVQNTEGAEFSTALDMVPDSLVVSKGDDPEREAYSGFQASGVELAAELRARGVERVFVTGLATDYCVRATALDAKKAGFAVVLVEDAVRGVAPETTEKALAELEQEGIASVNSDVIEPDGMVGGR